LRSTRAEIEQGCKQRKRSDECVAVKSSLSPHLRPGPLGDGKPRVPPGSTCVKLVDGR
jgi:hypothetical protein